MEFRVLLERDEDGFYVAQVPVLPGCISQERIGRKPLKT
jgi:predicted RNase H-like HicB family nuclease